MLHTFGSYGLRVLSDVDLRLPALAAPGSADVTVQRGPVVWPEPNEVPPGEGCWRADARSAYHAWAGVGAFLVEDGARITWDARPDVAPDRLRLSVLGPLLANVLLQRGCLVLHASAVSWRGQTIGVSAHSGTGKSTTAAAFVRHGAHLLTDDLLALTMQPVPTVWPGGAGLRLWPSSATAVGHDEAALPSVAAGGTKRFWALDTAAEPRRLDHLVLLESGDTPDVQRMPARLAVKEVMERSYCSELLRLHGGGDNLQQAAALVRDVPVWRATRGASLATLPDLVSAIAKAVGTPSA